MLIHTRIYKPSASSEIHRNNDETLIPVLINFPTFLVLLKTPTKKQIPSTDMTYM